MAHVSLGLLGSFRCLLNGQEVSGFRYHKARALLAYLAVESGREHSREVLADLLWPDCLTAAALTNLRCALDDLRTALAEREAAVPRLLVTRATLRLNPAADIEVDGARLEAALRRDDLTGLAEALGWVRGEFLEGFSIGSAPFEEWAALQQEHYAQAIARAHERLAEDCEARGDWASMADHAQCQIALQPWDEVAHRRIMRALTLAGQPAAALAHGEGYRRRLAEELQTPPEAETIALFQAIRNGEAILAVGRRALLRPRPSAAHRLVVAREAELAQLDAALARALAGEGRVAFVRGEPGSGKTILLAEFARRATEAHGSLLIAAGRSSALTGSTDPFLAVREALQMLLGDVDGLRDDSSLPPVEVARLRAFFPEALALLLAHGAALLETLIPGAALLRRIAACTPRTRAVLAQQARLESLLRQQSHPSRSRPVGDTRSALFGSLTALLRAVAEQHPLLVLLDDLQWADEGTITFLFHLGQRLGGSRILIVGAYRPTAGADDARAATAALAAAARELQRLSGDPAIDLDRADARNFVDTLVDSEPNRLGEDFRAALTARTGGNPLFTVELLRSLQARAQLRRDAANGWTVPDALDWGELPARVEAVIAEQMQRLPAADRALLTMAAVEGEECTAEAVAAALGQPEAEVIARLSEGLARQRDFVRPVAVSWEAGRCRSRYRFRHGLFQQYLLGQLDRVQRARSHAALGQALETLYGAAADERASQLAHHFEVAGMADKAISYLLLAGRRAHQLCAHDQAIALLTHGLELLARLPRSDARDRRDLALQLALGTCHFSRSGIDSSDYRATHERARALGERLGDQHACFQAYDALAHAAVACGDLAAALSLAERSLTSAASLTDPRAVSIAHANVAIVQMIIGNLLAGRRHSDLALAQWPGAHAGSVRSPVGDDPRVVLPYLAGTLVALGYSEQGLRRAAQGVAEARNSGDGEYAAVLLAATPGVALLCRDQRLFKSWLAELQAVARTDEGAFVRPIAALLDGCARIAAGAVDAGLAQVDAALAAWHRTAGLFGRWLFTYLAADVCMRAGHSQAALRLADQGLQVRTFCANHYLVAELLRVRGEALLLAAGDALAQQAEAEVCLREAIAVARRQAALLWELRAMLPLARLLAQRGQAAEAHALLDAIYAQFTEGFDQPDLREARELLARLPP